MLFSLFSKLKIAGALLVSFLVSTFLITYIYPSRSSTINKNYLYDIQYDSSQFIAKLFNTESRKQNEQIKMLAEEAKKGIYTPVAQGITKFESENGTAFAVSVRAMDWDDYKTYTINGKTIRVRVEKGKPSPSQQLLEKLAQRE